MNTLRISNEHEGMFRNLHPSDPLSIIMASYESAAEFMRNDVPSILEILSAMYDLIDLTIGENEGTMKLTLTEIEAILRQNGFDFINMAEMRENSCQSYIGGEIIGL